MRGKWGVSEGEVRREALEIFFFLFDFLRGVREGGFYR